MTIQSSHPGARTVGIFASTALAVLLAGASQLSAQHPVGHRVLPGGEHPAGMTAITPHSGAPGNKVTIYSAMLPPQTEVQVIVGALRSEFEVVTTGMTDASGRLMGADSIHIKVPEWVKNDRSYLLILTDMAYNPLAVTDLFHPTNADGLVTRKGKILMERSSCLSMSNDAGELYFLEGDLGEADLGSLAAGSEVKVEGRINEKSSCGSGTTIQITNLEKIPSR